MRERPCHRRGLSQLIKEEMGDAYKADHNSMEPAMFDRVLAAMEKKGVHDWEI